VASKPTSAKSKSKPKTGAKAKPKSKPKAKSKTKASGQASRSEHSLQAFRDALEKTVTISRDRLQEVVDDAVRRGRMTRGDAEELVGRLVTRGREGADDILAQLEAIVSQFGEATGRARSEVGGQGKKARKRTVKAVDRPLATADRARRRARIPGFPITAYDQLSVRQIDSRLQDLTRQELRRVRDYEQRHKARKGVLRAVGRKLDKQ
jgi:polyhydroxyalkanoate synthesis regulator phasin